MSQNAISKSLSNHFGVCRSLICSSALALAIYPLLILCFSAELKNQGNRMIPLLGVPVVCYLFLYMVEYSAGAVVGKSDPALMRNMRSHFWRSVIFHFFTYFLLLLEYDTIQNGKAGDLLFVCIAGVFAVIYFAFRNEKYPDVVYIKQRRSELGS